MQPSTGYTIGFAAAVCVVCSIFVSGSAVALKDKQEENKVLDRQKKVLTVAGLIEEGSKPSPDEVKAIFDKRIKAVAVDMETDKQTDSVDVTTYDQRKADKDSALNMEVPANSAKVTTMAKVSVVYQVVDEGGAVEQLILPIRGPGLWSTLRGYLSVEADGETIQGITFYEHGETPGLGGEVDNPGWKASWKGRKVYDDQGKVAIQVIKGKAGSPEEDPYQIDGLSGATITSTGVTKTLDFWLGEQGFQPYLNNFRNGGA